MKFNKWTLGLAAVGVVSLASVAKADEKLSVVQTALSSTTISGYVDTSAQWNFGTGNVDNPPYAYGGAGKADGFNLNVVQLTIAKPLDESEWASGYKVDLWFGPDANTLGTGSAFSGDVGNENADLAIKQAYVALRTPVGNGIDWKIGVFDTIIGYESSESPNNPNFTRSYGYTIEPTTHTGLLGTYRVCEEFSLSAGVANTFGPQINGRAHPNAGGGLSSGPKAESYKTYMASIALTAPQSWGWAAGSTAYAGVINGFNDPGSLSNTGQGNQTSWYSGATLATPVTGLKCGASFDYLDSHSTGAAAIGHDAYAIGAYASYQATEKLSLHARGELLTSQDPGTGVFAPLGAVAGKDNSQIWAFTGTVQYDLWQNVISRLEFRWDHGDEAKYFGGTTPNSRKNAYMVAANVVYKF